jgi:hypothetical protein
MGVAYTGESELVRIAAVDYFTGETLLDALVFPQVKMWHLKQQIFWCQLAAALQSP